MSNKEQQIPAIRFKGFTDVWEQRKLGELCEEFQSGKNIKAEDIKENGPFPVFGGNGIRGYSDTYNHDGVYALVGRQGALCGNMNISYGKAYFTEHAIAVKANISNDTKFLFYLLGKMNLGQYSSQSAQPGLAVNKLTQLSAFVPNSYEQKQISDFLICLDSTIALHQRQMDNYTELKKGMLQKIFSQDGEKDPEIRFEGFSEEWQQRKLIEIADYRNGKAHEQHISENGLFIVINSKFVSTNGKVRKYSDKQIEPMRSNEIAFVLSDVPNGRAIARTYLVDENGKYTLNQRIAGITPHSNTNTYFLHQLMNRHNYFLRFDDGVKQTNLSKENIENFTESYPSHEEQIKVGNFFKNLDNTIALHQQKISNYKTLKSSLLNKMFV